MLKQLEIDVCKNCKKRHHRKDWCWIIHGKPKDKPRSMQSQESGSHLETSDFRKYSLRADVDASSFLSHHNEEIVSLIIDSGCSDHMIPYRSRIVDLTRSMLKIQIASG
jgi:hypothetical protein